MTEPNASSPNAAPTLGVLPDVALAEAFDRGWLKAEAPLVHDQLQPASVDLRLGAVAYRLRASFLPGPGKTVDSQLTKDLVMHQIDLTGGAVLETGCVYLVPLQESAALPQHVSGLANPKSSTGRIDVFTRVITDGAAAFDLVPAGYQGPLWAEVCPCTFSVLVRAGSRLSQLRLRAGTPPILRRLDLGIDLMRPGPVGFRAKRHAGVIDVEVLAGQDPRDFWEPLEARGGHLVLDPGEFYIFASAEPVLIPTQEAAEMTAVRTELGEFRAHYAGFFDPGFGVPPHQGRAVLEVRGRDVPFRLDHGQPMGALVFEPLSAPCAKLYGETGSSYQGQGLKLSKHFQPWS